MSTADPPEVLYLLDIVAVTWGSKDYTSVVRARFATYLSQNPTTKTYSITASNGWFGEDPNHSVSKACVVAWRNTFPLPSGEIVWSTVKSAARLEGAADDTINVSFDGQGDTQWVSPDAGAFGHCIVAAYWFSSDRTDITRTVTDRQAYNRYSDTNELAIDVSAVGLGQDPATSNDSKQFTVIYGNRTYPQTWNFAVQVGMGPNSGWTLRIPTLFPPVTEPWAGNFITYVTFKNDRSDQSLYPQIYGSDLSLAWDGRDAGFLIPAGQKKDVELIERAGLTERTWYWCGWCTTDGTIVGGCTSQQVVASSSASGQPCAISATNPYKIDYLSMNEPMQYLPRDLRLNIYTVTWGSKICTDFVRQKYITSTIANPPTDSSNSWSIDASNTNFSDGDPNVAKALVIFYRVAQVIGHTDGIINGPNDPPPWSDDYRTKNIQPLHTNRYPVLKDFTKFYMATAREGFTINIDLLSMLPLQPYTVFPEPQNRPFIAAAAWSTRQVTDYTIDSVRNTPAGTDTRLSVGTATMGVNADPRDPWSGWTKQCTVLAGYATNSDPHTFQWRTIIDMPPMPGLDPWYLTIPYNLPAPNTAAAWPANYPSQEIPAFINATFVNKTTWDAWPRIVTAAGQAFWDGKAVDKSKYRLPASPSGGGSTKIVNLIADASCMEGESYGLAFVVDGIPPIQPAASTGWVKATGVDRWKVSLTWGPDGVMPGKWGIYREISFGG